MANNTTPLTNTEIRGAIRLMIAVADAIREAGGGLPEGPLYAAVMDRISLASFNSLLRTLVGAKLIRRDGHLIRWIGPEHEVPAPRCCGYCGAERGHEADCIKAGRE